MFSGRDGVDVSACDNSLYVCHLILALLKHCVAMCLSFLTLQSIVLLYTTKHAWCLKDAMQIPELDFS